MNKKIAFLIPGLSSGGAERVLSTISTNISDNIDQYILTWNAKEVDYEFNAKIIEINTKNSRYMFANIFVLLKRIISVRKYKKKYDIKTCISHLEGANIVNLLSKVNEKTIITVHNFQSDERKGVNGIIFKVLIKLLYNKADKIIAVSKLIKDDLINNFNIDKNKIDVIYNPFDIEKITRLSEEEIDKNVREILGNNYIISVGRLTKQKGQWHLIKAFSELKKSVSDIKLVILGKGEMEIELKELAIKLGLDKDVIFLGFQNNPFKYIKHAKIFALTSLYEGFPMCIVEAMACGTPIISVDCKSGPREILDIKGDYYSVCNSEIEYKKYGILCPAFSDKDIDFSKNISIEERMFFKALNELINNNEMHKKYSKYGKKRAEELDVKEIIGRWNDIF